MTTERLLPIRGSTGQQEALDDDAFDPGATICGHAPRHERHHYLGGGLWVCFACLVKLFVGGRKESARCR